MPSTNGGDIEFTERMSAASDVGQGDTEVSLVTNAPDVTQSLLKLGRRTDSLLDGRCKHEARKARPWLPSRCIDDGSGNLGPGKAPPRVQRSSPSRRDSCTTTPGNRVTFAPLGTSRCICFASAAKDLKPASSREVWLHNAATGLASRTAIHINCRRLG
jgi:hypothetical protein